MTKKDREQQDKDIDVKCPFCHGTGIAKCFDFKKNYNLPNGTYELTDLIDKYGEYTECPEGCWVLN